MAVTLEPLGDRVVLKAKLRDEVTSSGIVLPATTTEKPQEGIVLSVGPGRYLDNGQHLEMDVSVGDTVLFARYAGTEINLDGEDFLVMRESDLLAIIHPAKEGKSARAEKSAKRAKHSKK
jgi:chaperonin GroES